MNILSIFAGRKQNIEILQKYLKKALELHIIDEVHFWNNTRNSNDEEYLKTISNLRRTSSTNDGQYNLITPTMSDNSFELHVKAPNDIHIKLTNVDTEYEIVLGGWNNTKSVVRENNHEIFYSVQNDVADGEKGHDFKIMVHDKNILNIFKDDRLLFTQKIKDDFNIQNIYFKTGFESVGELTYKTTRNQGFYFMDTCEKSWKNYYSYYSSKTYENDIIIKCDDDIVFVDLYKLPKFIDFIKNNNYDLVFANTINNGVAAYFQQNKYHLIPQELMELEYPVGGYYGSLWESGQKAERLHDFFIAHYDSFLDYNYNNDIIPINTRFSINFFGYKGKNWHKLQDSYPDDEYNLTVDYVKNRQFNNVLYSDFYVSHLSFYKQNETDIDLHKLLRSYDTLYWTMVETGRFK